MSTHLTPAEVDDLRFAVRADRLAGSQSARLESAVEKIKAEAAGAALTEAGARVANMRHTISGRKVANAEWLGQVVYAMGDDIAYEAERRARANQGGTQ